MSGTASGVVESCEPGPAPPRDGARGSGEGRGLLARRNARGLALKQAGWRGRRGGARATYRVAQQHPCLERHAQMKE